MFLVEIFAELPVPALRPFTISSSSMMVILEVISFFFSFTLPAVTTTSSIVTVSLPSCAWTGMDNATNRHTNNINNFFIFRSSL
jgi:hypothetical protein